MTDLRDVLVITDLDGTLLDHATYAWAAATPALDLLRMSGAGLILASSKTAAEIAPLRDEIGFTDWPSIVENGSGLLGAEAGNETYMRLRRAIKDLPQGFHGFGDMDAQEVSERTGLSLEAAERAKTRQYSEPGLWTGAPDDLRGFIEAATTAELTAQQGGRFVSLSFGGTKAQRAKELIRRLAPAHTIILGDAPNDAGMLDLADSGVIVANPASGEMPRLPVEDTGRIRRTQKPGPAGWSDAVLDIVQELEDRKDKRANG
ncbi:MAG: HAD hydrolase family protein [Pseudomonadota bacterium]